MRAATNWSPPIPMRRWISAVMIGDTPWDCAAAARAGVPTWTVKTGGFSDAELREAGARGVSTTVAELVAGLDETLE